MANDKKDTAQTDEAKDEAVAKEEAPKQGVTFPAGKPQTLPADNDKRAAFLAADEERRRNTKGVDWDAYPLKER